MAKNSNVFQANPVRLDISRSKFHYSPTWTGTFNTGKVIPIFSYGDVLPGDTFKIDCSLVIRSTTPVAPVMDNCFADVYFFFTPHKQVLSRHFMSPSVNDSNRSFEAFIGAQDSLLNMPLPSDVTLPVVEFGKDFNLNSGAETNFEIGSLADYLGMPYFTGNTTAKRNINALEPLAYYDIWNNYFRDPNTMSPVTYSIQSSPVVSGFVVFYGGVGINNMLTIGGTNSVLPACRPHGYFGSALPWPQRNTEAVQLPLGDLAPLVASGDLYDTGLVKFNSTDVNNFTLRASSSNSTITRDVDNGINGTNLRVDLSEATAANVNALRFAVQAQRWYEALARGGNRLGELTRSMFNVTPSDIAADRPEYLGGKRIPINVQQVTNTAGTQESVGSQMSIGSTGAYSLTSDKDYYFTKSFDTWGTITAVLVIRTHESFHQGLNRRYSRRTRFDFYWPQFANLGEQDILNKEIYFDGSSRDDEVFGYQEAWAEYRYMPDIVTGHARPVQSQAYWNYCNNFGAVPDLASYLDASGQKTNVDRTLQVPSGTAGFQWMANVCFDIDAVRPMPTYSIPGLMDHH